MGEQIAAWRVPAVPSAVLELRRMLLARIAGRGFDTDAVALAVTEAVTNVVRHAYSAPGGTVMLRTEASADELSLSFDDFAVSGLVGFQGLHDRFSFEQSCCEQIERNTNPNQENLDRDGIEFR